MTDDPAISAVIAAAERAAVAGDYLGAERHLREAVSLQEAKLGLTNPDLANTLNNLGVACEQAGKLDEAEAAYRRAFDIAQQAFPPDHPFVIRSAENLRDFCNARGRAFEVSTPPPPVVPVVIEPTPSAVTMELDQLTYQQVHPSAPGPGATTTEAPRRGLTGIAIVIAALAIVAIVIWSGGRLPSGTGPTEAARPSTSAEAPMPDSTSEPAGMPAPVSPIPADPAAPAPSGPEGTQPVRPEAPGQGATVETPIVAGGFSVIRADVCRDFLPRSGAAEWRCTVVSGTAPPGTLAYYTRIKSAKAVTVEHRWYHGDRLDHRASLRVGANPGAGYRTFSRNTIASNEAGNWRVELRTSAGALIHEVRFSVH